MPVPAGRPPLIHYLLDDWNILLLVTDPGAGEARGALHEQFARIGRAMASPRRIELLELLCQGERTVESLARATGMGITNTSQHLQVLKSARLVEARREGTRVYHRAADDHVCHFASELGAVARARLLEVERIARDHLDGRDALEPIRREDLLARLARRDVVVVDVRPAEEYRAGHIPGARSIPVSELKERLRELPKRREIVAYCRGPYCVMAIDAVELLRKQGFRAQRMEQGVLEWRARGWRVEAGSEEARS